MRTRGRWALALLAALAWGNAGARADDGDLVPTQHRSLWDRWFGKDEPEKKKPAESKPPARPEKSDKVETPDRPRVLGVEAAAAIRAREEAVLLRRQEVCLKLLQIATETGDLELQNQAEQLNERAWNVYLQRTGKLPGAGNGSTSDEMVLQMHLGTSESDTVRRLEGKKTGAEASGQVSTLREEK
jgi:hypothetical protein